MKLFKPKRDRDFDLLVDYLDGELSTLKQERLEARLKVEPELASRIASAWSALSNACHYQSYEFAPTAVELEEWLASVEAFVLCCDHYAEGK